ncbi:MAG TPA: hypothetical protein VMZ69_08625 [Saprospiraceae bacterium]|nr:hypothetical protein [Saprospiraceae bacterium]
MDNKLRPIFSLVTMIIFLMLALGSFGPDQSTNTTVAIKDCEVKPPVSGTLRVNVHLQEKSGASIANATGTLFLTQQEVKPDETCTFTSFTFVEPIATDNNGNWIYGNHPFTHDNSQDLWRAEVVITKTAIFTECRVVKVIYYPGSQINVKCVVKRLNEL